MENASKALIIAGAILIAILLIGIGVGLINALNNPMDIATGQLDEQAKKMINSKFENYAGKQSGKNIYDTCLCSHIIAQMQMEILLFLKARVGKKQMELLVLRIQLFLQLIKLHLLIYLQHLQK